MSSTNAGRYLVVAIDPGSGSSSACGLAAITPENRAIVCTRAFWPLKYTNPAVKRIKDIVEQLDAQLKMLAVEFPQRTIVVGIESFVMRGKGGETLQRFIGAALSRVAFDYKIIEIQNTTMKKWVGGRGASSKEDVAIGVAAFFAPNDASAGLVSSLIEDNEADVIDALGIGITTIKKEGIDHG